MDLTTIIVLSQVVLAVVAIIVFLALYARRQKKAVAHLQDLLTEFKEEMSGETLERYLQLSINDTAANCQQETVNLNPAETPENQALSLRYHALSYELANLQTYSGEMTPITTALTPYQDIAEAYHKHLNAKLNLLKDEVQSELNGLNKKLSDSHSKLADAEGKLKALSALTEAFDKFDNEELDKHEIELELHNALIDVCENFTNPAAFREVVYQIHEGFMEFGLRDSGTDEANEKEPEFDYDQEEMFKLVEQFTEESAEMVERLHLITNQNKQLMLENEELRTEINATHEEGDEEREPLVAGLKIKIETQTKEILELQNNYKKLEQKYLSLYSESNK